METHRFDHNDAATIPASGLIYALQTKPPSILELTPDGTQVKTLIDNLGGRPDGVQVDATRGLIYFSMMGKPRLLDAREDFSAADGSIECCNLDGSILVDTALVFQPPENYRDRAARVRADGIALLADGVIARWVTPAFLEAPETTELRTMLLRTPPED
jgi:hypothetical protein